MSNDKVGEVEEFKYLEPYLQNNDCSEEDMKHWIKCGWMSYKEILVVLGDKRVRVKVERKMWLTSGCMVGNVEQKSLDKWKE